MAHYWFKCSHFTLFVSCMNKFAKQDISVEIVYCTVLSIPCSMCNFTVKICMRNFCLLPGIPVMKKRERH